MKKFIQLTILGFTIGVLVGVFQLGGRFLIEQSAAFFRQDNLWINIGVVVILVLIAALIRKKDQIASSSGVPSIENYLEYGDTIKDHNILLIFLNSWISFFCGLPLGSEGPSVFLGGSVGILVNRWFHDNDNDLVGIGTASGFSCAFLNPLAGFIYYFEETLEHFRLKAVIPLIYVLAVSYVIIMQMNPHQMFHFTITEPLPFANYWLLLPLTIVSVGGGWLFLKCFLRMKAILKRSKWKPRRYLLFIVFAFALLAQLYFRNITGGGTILINALSQSTTLRILLLLFFVRFTWIILSANSGAAGGLLIPMFSLGALLGAMVAQGANSLGLLSIEHQEMFVVISMVSFYGVVTKSKWTALALSIGYAPASIIFLPAIITIFLSAYLDKKTKTRCIYEYLKVQLHQDRLLNNTN